MTGEPVLKVESLQTVFNTRDGKVHAVNGVSFSLSEGELLGVVGESGSGKSVTMMSLIKLLPSPPAEIVSGRVLFEGRDVLEMSDEELRRLRGNEIGFVFQDPMTSLNPVFTVGFQLKEALRSHGNISSRAAKAQAINLLEQVGIPSAKDRLKEFPHQFSGGMRQRVMIAMALACNPKVLIADEPTTALDVTIQAQIIELVKELRESHGTGIIWITHDLGVVAGIADRVMVMYGGQIAEHASVKTIFNSPAHPYTKALLQTLPGRAEAAQATTDTSMPLSGENQPTRLKSIEGQPPSLNKHPVSCPFAPRCESAFERCHQENPPVTRISPEQEVACWLYHEQAGEAVSNF